jgi:hypothetical protein
MVSLCSLGPRATAQRAHELRRHCLECKHFREDGGFHEMFLRNEYPWNGNRDRRKQITTGSFIREKLDICYILLLSHVN